MKKLANTGITVSEISSELTSANTMVSASGANIRPSRPVSENSGRNTMAMMRMPDTTGVATSVTARYTRCNRLTPFGACASWE